MKKLRIAVWHNLPSGGAKRQVYYHVKGLIERGHYVEAWCPDSADGKFLPLGDIIKENVLPLDDIKGNPNVAFRLGSNLSLFSRKSIYERPAGLWCQNNSAF